MKLNDIRTATVLLLALLLHQLTSATNSSDVCPDEYHVFQRGSCIRIISTPETWNEARNVCAAEGAQIASVHSASEMRFIRALMWGARVQKIFLGVYKPEGASEFINDDATYVNFSLFKNGTSSNRTEKTCVTSSRAFHSKWSLSSCNVSTPYVCKTNAEPSIYISQRHRCYTCINALSNDECNAGGIHYCHLGECCQNEIRVSNNIKLITKRCKQKAACANNFLQNVKAAWRPSQCAPAFGVNSVCRCCCDGDLCNSRELPCLNETSCNPLSMPQHGTMRCSDGQNPGSVCTFRCLSGYALFGVELRHCDGQSGTWTHSTPTCKPITCSPEQSAPENGFVNCNNDNRYRSRCRFSCNHLHAIRGASILSCGLTGRWNYQTPICSLITCPDNIEAPTDGRMNSPPSDAVPPYVLSTQITFSCDVGYYVTRNPTLTCVDRNRDGVGEWDSPLPECGPIICPNLDAPNNSRFRGIPQTRYGSILTIDCNEGYFLTGDNDVQCVDEDNNGAGEWNKRLPICRVIACPTPNPPSNSRFRNPPQIIYGSILTIDCNGGYFLTDDNHVECVDEDNNGAGEWNKTLPTCRLITCPPQEPSENGLFRNPLQTRYGSILRIDCNEGYFLTGNNDVECIDEDNNGAGEWNKRLPTCNLITCAAPEPPTNGRFQNSAQTIITYGSMLSITCNEGYFLSGNRVIQCIDSNRDGVGDWNGSLPICQLINCSLVVPPVNSRFRNPLQTRYGSILTIDCNEGYFLHGDNDAQCVDEDNNGAGEWNKRLPTCNVITCPSQEPPENSFFQTPIQTIYGSTLTVNCNEGYFATDDNHVECVDEDNNGAGEWDKRLPTCNVITCSPPEPPVNGEFQNSTQTITYGSMLSIICNEGYFLFGNGVIQCIDSNQDGVGDWNGSLPICKLISCSLAAPPENSRFRNPPQIRYGSILTIDCNDGYFLTGDNHVECVDEDDNGAGEWNKRLPTCREITCSTPRVPQHATIFLSLPRLLYGAEITFTCNDKYFLNGNSTIRCVDPDNDGNGEWTSDSPLCQLITCPEIAPPENGLFLSPTLFEKGSVIRIGCWIGYFLIGNPVVTCLDQNRDGFGSWNSSLPTCERILCAFMANLTHGSTLCIDANSFGSRCLFSCNEGYRLVGNNESRCIDEDDNGVGEWNSSQPVCEKITCISSLTPPNNGDVTCTDKANLNARCHYECEEGFYLIGSDISICLDEDRNGFAEWSHPPAICKQILCERQASPLNGSVSCSQGFNYGSVCSFECHFGYSLIGANSTRCREGEPPRIVGTWTDENSPICQINRCSPIPFDPTNGTHSCNNVNYYQSECDYACAEGYQLIGQRTRRCQADKTWDSTQPMCEILRCSIPTNPDHGLADCTNGNFYGSTCSYLCDFGFKLLGSKTIRCSLDQDGDGFGDYTNVPPLCQAVYCPEMEFSIEDGVVECEGGVVGGESNIFSSTCVLVCDEGWIAEGTARTTCNSKGQWTATLGRCRRYSCVPPLLIPIYGIMTCSTFGDVIGSTCSFRCEPGTRIVGENVITCLDDGRWSHTPPICVGT